VQEKVSQFLICTALCPIVTHGFTFSVSRFSDRSHTQRWSPKIILDAELFCRQSSARIWLVENLTVIDRIVGCRIEENTIEEGLWLARIDVVSAYYYNDSCLNACPIG
jgi:hypothetical protein